MAWPIRDKRTITIARGLAEKVILPYGTPRLLLSDNGKEFENELCHELCRLLGIEKQRTTFYSPQCNGSIERWHSTMNSLLAKNVEVHQRDWPQRLPYVVSAYNSSVHEATGYTPNFLMFARELDRGVDIVLGNPSSNVRSCNDYVEHVVEMMAKAYDDVRAHLGRSAERAKQYYDFKSKLTSFQVGELVWVYSPRRFKGRSPKWQRCYSGPFEIVRQVNSVNYVVQKSPRSNPVIVHVNKLKPYLQPGLAGHEPHQAG